MSDITILISTSPRHSHPSPRILDQTLISVRAQLPNAPIIIMADGFLDETYEGNRYRGFLDAIRDRYTNTVVQTRNQIVQQSGMLSEALQAVQTPLVFYLEDDWELRPSIEWDGLSNIIQSGYANYIRLYNGHRVSPYHEHMMLKRVVVQGIPLIHTTQWSQNPHLASTAFYRDQVLSYCQGKTDMIENLLHGPCASEPWERWKLCIYNPYHDASMSRLHHLDGKNTL